MQLAAGSRQMLAAAIAGATGEPAGAGRPLDRAGSRAQLSSAKDLPVELAAVLAPKAAELGRGAY
jgi:hypothetical protein